MKYYAEEIQSLIFEKEEELVLIKDKSWWNDRARRRLKSLKDKRGELRRGSRIDMKDIFNESRVVAKLKEAFRRAFRSEAVRELLFKGGDDETDKEKTVQQRLNRIYVSIQLDEKLKEYIKKESGIDQARLNRYLQFLILNELDSEIELPDISDFPHPGWYNFARDIKELQAPEVAEKEESDSDEKTNKKKKAPKEEGLDY